MRLCGFALVGEIKKGSTFTSIAPAPVGSARSLTIRQETLEEAYSAMLRRISIDEAIVTWISTPLRESHTDQKRFRDEAIAKLQAGPSAAPETPEV